MNRDGATTQRARNFRDAQWESSNEEAEENLNRDGATTRRSLGIEQMRENELDDQVIEAAFRVHRHFGPGLLENAYEACLAYELVDMGLSIETQVALPLVYHDVRLDVGYRLDIWVERKFIIEVKAVSELHPIHLAQILTYLKLTGNKLGRVINFNSPLLKHGMKRVVNNL